MSAVQAAFGLRPIYHPTGLDRGREFQSGIPSGFTSNIFKYQPVSINTSGQVVPITTNGVDFIGVFSGLEYVDATGKPVYSPNWIANTSMQAGSVPRVYVWTDALIVYEIQADGSVAQSGAQGNQFNFNATDIATPPGSTVTGLSSMRISATGVGNGVQGMLRCLDISRYVDNAWADAFTILTVQIARSQDIANKVAY